MPELTQRDFEGLLEFRVTLRRFHVRLTGQGDRKLRQLTPAHPDRLHELAVVLVELVTRHDNHANSRT